jgi:hypothetical protein
MRGKSNNCLVKTKQKSRCKLFRQVHRSVGSGLDSKSLTGPDRNVAVNANRKPNRPVGEADGSLRGVLPWDSPNRRIAIFVVDSIANSLIREHESVMIQA